MFFLKLVLLGSVVFVGIAIAYATWSFALFWGNGRQMALAAGALLFALAHALAATIKYRAAFFRKLPGIGMLTIASAVVWSCMGAAAGFWLDFYAPTSSWQLSFVRVSALVVVGGYFGATLGFSVSYRLLAVALQVESGESSADKEARSHIFWRAVVPVVGLFVIGIGYQVLSDIYPEPIGGNLTVGMLFLGLLAVGLATFRWALLLWLQAKRRI